MDLSLEIIKRAKIQAEELNYSLPEALADILGALLFEVDACLEGETTEAGGTIMASSEFQKIFNGHVVEFSRQCQVK